MSLVLLLFFQAAKLPVEEGKKTVLFSFLFSKILLNWTINTFQLHKCKKLIKMWLYFYATYFYLHLSVLKKLNVVTCSSSLLWDDYFMKNLAKGLLVFSIHLLAALYWNYLLDKDQDPNILDTNNLLYLTVIIIIMYLHILYTKHQREEKKRLTCSRTCDTSFGSNICTLHNVFLNSKFFWGKGDPLQYCNCYCCLQQ